MPWQLASAAIIIISKICSDSCHWSVVIRSLDQTGILGPDYMGRAGPVGRFPEIPVRLSNTPKIGHAITWKPGQPGQPGSRLGFLRLSALLYFNAPVRAKDAPFLYIFLMPKIMLNSWTTLYRAFSHFISEGGKVLSETAVSNCHIKLGDSLVQVIHHIDEQCFRHYPS